MKSDKPKVKFSQVVALPLPGRQPWTLSLITSESGTSLHGAAGVMKLCVLHRAGIQSALAMMDITVINVILIITVSKNLQSSKNNKLSSQVIAI